ncbi:MAG: plasmid mobilization relaxosome protein MobC [Planctomycetota bacterium]
MARAQAKRVRETPLAGGGRPMLAEGERRSEQVNVRYTIAELEGLHAAARIAGLHPVEYVRRRSLGVPIVPPQTKADQQLLFELNAIGVNLNQLTKRINTGDDRDLDDQLKASMKQLQSVLAKVAGAFE